MGEVFLAWDERLERQVAIKRVRTDVFLEGRQRERFRREARMAARLSHASIVQIHDLVVDDAGGTGDAIVMEYVEGQTLADRLVRGPLPIADALRIAREIAEGLAAAHEAGLIHRDLKAENVIVTPAGHAKILDFGLARPLFRDGEKLWDGEGLTQQGALIGTCYAMSPEQASGDDLDERSDLFSFGALVYQMVAGRSPFRAENPQATLTRVLTAHPRPLSEDRPDTPPGLVHLVERLLAKDRDDRPRNAEQVVRSLQQIERGLPAEDLPGPDDNSLSNMSTDVLSPIRSKGTAATEAPVRRVKGWILVLAGALAALVLAATLPYLLARRDPRPARTRQVLVMKPETLGVQDEGLSLAAAGVLSSTLSGLANLQGISALDPAAAQHSSSVLEAARNVAADEVLISALQKDGRMARVDLRRVDAAGGVLWSDSLRVSTDPAGLRLLNDGIDQLLREAYEGFAPRQGRPLLAASDLDFAEYLEVRQQLDAGTRDLRPVLEQLARIVDRSPRFLDALVLAAELFHSLFESTKKPADLQRARAYVQQARQLAPLDPRTQRVEFLVALAARQQDEAARILENLEAGNPGDLGTLLLRSRLEESRGRFDKAEEALRLAVERSPSWRNISWLASLELERGKVSEARRHLNDLLKQTPGNLWIQEQLAYLELIYGDLQRAEQIYGQLARSHPQRSHFTSLGQARSLRGRFKEAEEAYSRALEIDPGHPIAMLNLADTELDLGNRPSADALYGAVLQRLEGGQLSARLSSKEEMMKAQCLARLDRAAEAREAARNGLSLAPHDAQRLFEAALVHSVIGDRAAALAFARDAVSRGMAPRWFQASAFDPLRQEPGFQSLLRSGGPEQGR